MTRLLPGAVFVFVSLALLMYGCKDSKETSVDLGKDVLAVVNGETITTDDYRVSLDGEIPDKADAKSAALERLISNKLAAKEAIAQGLLGTPEVLNGIEGFYNDRLPDLLTEKIAKATTVSDEELLSYKKSKGLKTTLGVSVLVAPTIDAAQAALSELKKGANFKEVAAKHSTIKDETDAEFGLGEGTYPPGVMAVLNRLKPGELSPPMKLEIGYAVFRLNYRNEPDQIWNSMEASARREIKQQKIDAELARLVDKLRSSADLKVQTQVAPGGQTQYIGATVNGVELKMDPMLFAAANDPHSPHANLNPRTLKDALNKRINQVLLSQEARRQGLQNDPAFQRDLQLKKEEVLAGVITERVRGKSEPSARDMMEYYEANKSKYAEKRRMRVSRILLASEEDASAALKEIKAGKDFAAVAKARSIDSSTRDKGGDAGYVAYELVKEPIKSALTNLKVGEVSGIVKSEYGFEILKATDKKESVPPPLSAISSLIKKRVVLVKNSERVEAFYKTLHEKADIKINKKLLESLRSQ